MAYYIAYKLITNWPKFEIGDAVFQTTINVCVLCTLYMGRHIYQRPDVHRHCCRRDGKKSIHYSFAPYTYSGIYPCPVLYYIICLCCEYSARDRLLFVWESTRKKKISYPRWQPETCSDIHRRSLLHTYTLYLYRYTLYIYKRDVLDNLPQMRGG